MNDVLLTAVGTVALLALSACGDTNQRGSLERAQKFLSEKQFSAAIIELKNVVQQPGPDEAQARFLLAKALRETEDYGAAEIEIRKAKSQGLQGDEVTLELLSLMADSSQFNDLVEEAKQYTGQDKVTRALVYAMMCEAYIALAKSTEASDACKEAAALDPTHPKVKFAQGHLADSRGDLVAAASFVEESLKGSPDDPSVLFYAAILRDATGKTSDAIPLLERVMVMRPTSPRAYMVAIPVYLRSGDTAKARTATNRLNDATKRRGPYGSYLLALVDLAEGQREMARENVQSALKVFPTFGPALALAGKIELELGNHQQAQAQLLKALEANPKNSYARKLLATSYIRAGASAKAKEHLETLTRENPTDAEAWRLLGEWESGLGRFSAALAAFEKSRQINPADKQARVKSAQVKLLAGDSASAITELDAIVKSNTNDDSIQAEVVLALHHLKSNAPEKALQTVDAALQKSPKSPLLHNLKGMVLRASANIEGAREAFLRAQSLDATFYPAVQNRAMSYVEVGDFDAAAKVYADFLKANPRHESALIATADLAMRRNATQDERLKAIDQIVVALPDSVEGHLMKIGFFEASRKATEALKAAEAAIAAVPDDLRLLDALARAQRKAGQSDQAIQTYNRILLNPNTSNDPYLRQADIYASRADWKSARAVISRALARSPNSADLRLARFRLLVLEGANDDALKEAKEMQRIYPTQAVGYVAEADAWTAKKSPEQAIAALKGAMSKVDTPQISMRLFGVLESQGLNERADEVVRDWIKKHPGDATVPAAVANSLLGKQDWKRAARWYGIAIEIQPGNADYVNNLAWTLGQLNDPSALDVAVKAQGLAPSDPAILETVGALHLKSGNVKEAVALLEKAVKLAPSRMDIRLSLAKALTAGKSFDQAKAQLDVISSAAIPASMRTEVENLRGQRN